MTESLTERETETAPFLTLIPDRHPRKKSHLGLGEAKKAVLNRLSQRTDGTDSVVKVYRWDERHGWVILWDIPEGTPREKLPWIARG